MHANRLFQIPYITMLSLLIFSQLCLNQSSHVLSNSASFPASPAYLPAFFTLFYSCTLIPMFTLRLDSALHYSIQCALCAQNCSAKVARNKTIWTQTHLFDGSDGCGEVTRHRDRFIPPRDSNILLLLIMGLLPVTYPLPNGEIMMSSQDDKT
jgi:hypothetical protein